jgi:transcriptional regulator with XRE-family HTH domain
MIARQDPHEVLAELSTDLGLSWTTLARMIGVTPTAIRKWRKGDSISSDNRRKISRARGFLELLTRNANPLEDVGSWLEIKVSGDSTLTAVDLFAGERMDLVLDLASARISPHEALEAFDPDWRSHHAADQAFKVVRASDGLPAIVETNSEQ